MLIWSCFISNSTRYVFKSECSSRDSSGLPSVERQVMETPTPHNPLGAKGIGEAATIGSTPAIHNAVIDALAPFGIRHLDMPLTPARIWAALEATGQ